MQDAVQKNQGDKKIDKFSKKRNEVKCRVYIQKNRSVYVNRRGRGYNVISATCLSARLPDVECGISV